MKWLDFNSGPLESLLAKNREASVNFIGPHYDRGAYQSKEFEKLSIELLCYHTLQALKSRSTFESQTSSRITVYV